MLSKERLQETLDMLYKDLSDVEQSITSIKLTLVERETKRLTIIDAIEDVERMINTKSN